MKVFRNQKFDTSKKRKLIYDTKVTINFEKKQLDRFREIVGAGYQVKIRDLVQCYIDAYDRKVNEYK